MEGRSVNDVMLTTTSLPGDTTTNKTYFCPIVQAYVDIFYIYVIGMGPVILIGFITNALNIFLLRRYFSKINSFLLLQFLSCTDLFFLFVCFLYFPIRHLHILATRGDEIMRRDDWSHGVHILQVVDPLFYLGQAARNWTVLMVTVERFLSMVFPAFADQKLTRKRLIIAWIVLILIACIQPINSYRIMTFENVVNDCNGDPETIIRYKHGYAYAGHIWRIFYIVGVIVVPVLLMWIMNITMISILRRSMKQKAETDGINSQRDISMERQATLMVIAVLTVFTICETPACLDRIVSMAGVRYEDAFHFFQYCRKIALFLNVLHSSLNFWAYCVSNASFRQHLVKFVMRRADNVNKPDLTHDNLSDTDTRVQLDEV